MKYLSDQVVSRLQAAVQSLDLAGTRYRALKFLDVEAWARSGWRKMRF